MLTGRQMCDHIVAAGIGVKNHTTDQVCKTSEEIWNLDSHGSLYHVYELYETACGILGKNADGTPYRKIVNIDKHGNIIREGD